HCPVIRPGPALGCNFCWNTIDGHGRILRRKTKYHCPECQTNLCIVPCFQEYHERLNNEIEAATASSSATNNTTNTSRATNSSTSSSVNASNNNTSSNSNQQQETRTNVQQASSNATSASSRHYTKTETF
ncbi:repressor of RNA polymerase III transcription-like, partial [Lucilia sericata]|uniref:repressor of RNA polymerase III transcription-like n=1 Tax=Lucilia sericata TaxID=13632 RepID=UPI0018A825FF